MPTTRPPRLANFYAGPSTLPTEVLEQLEDTIVDYRGRGLSMIETSHRSGMYEEVHEAAEALLREMLGIPADYHVLFLGGGATLQFSMVPLNLMPEGGSCDFVMSGSWAKKAVADAKKLGSVNAVYDGADSGYIALPDAVSTSDGASYLHITSNETINGVQWPEFPEVSDVPLVADMSSDIASRLLDVERFGLLYAGAQKNLGPAGVAVVVIRDDLVPPARDGLTAYLSYRTHVDKGSLYNTPPVFSIYGMKLVLDWVKKNGGVEEMERRASEKSGLLYGAIDGSDGFYHNPVVPAYRSRMNVVFRLPTEELEKQFLAKAEENGMIGLKGHRSVGGCRASLYNALPMEHVRALASLMKEFAEKHG